MVRLPLNNICQEEIGMKSSGKKVFALKFPIGRDRRRCRIDIDLETEGEMSFVDKVYILFVVAGTVYRDHFRSV